LLEKYFWLSTLSLEFEVFNAAKLIVIYLIERKICLHGMDVLLLGGSKYVRQLISI